MKTIVIYNSATGFTKLYAEWIARHAGADCVTLSDAQGLDLSGYDAIVFGSWVQAGSIRQLDWFRKRTRHLRDRLLILFCTGAMPQNDPEVARILCRGLSEKERGTIHRFYLPGGINYEAMSVSGRAVMKMMARSIRSKKNKTKEQEELSRIIGSSYDLTDQKYALPILKLLKEAEKAG